MQCSNPGCTGCLLFDYIIKLIPTGRPAPYPKYVPQVKVQCTRCGKYIKFASQTDALVKAINDKQFFLQGDRRLQEEK